MRCLSVILTACLARIVGYILSDKELINRGLLFSAQEEATHLEIARPKTFINVPILIPAASRFSTSFRLPHSQDDDSNTSDLIINRHQQRNRKRYTSV